MNPTLVPLQLKCEEWLSPPSMTHTAFGGQAQPNRTHMAFPLCLVVVLPVIVLIALQKVSTEYTNSSMGNATYLGDHCLTCSAFECGEGGLAESASS